MGDLRGLQRPSCNASLGRPDGDVRRASFGPVFSMAPCLLFVFLVLLLRTYRTDGLPREKKASREDPDESPSENLKLHDIKM
jgi:hypothetical protein